MILKRLTLCINVAGSQQPESLFHASCILGIQIHALIKPTRLHSHFALVWDPASHVAMEIRATTIKAIIFVRSLSLSNDFMVISPWKMNKSPLLTDNNESWSAVVILTRLYKSRVIQNAGIFIIVWAEYVCHWYRATNLKSGGCLSQVAWHLRTRHYYFLPPPLGFALETLGREGLCGNEVSLCKNPLRCYTHPCL